MEKNPLTEKRITSTITTIALLMMLSTHLVVARVFTNKEVGKKNHVTVDSLKTSEYPYSLPIWGAKAAKASYNLPYSAGLSAQYFSSELAILRDNLIVGFNNGPIYNIDNIIRFNDSYARASAFATRPDTWFFPFLNVYGIFGVATAETDVNFGVWMSDEEGGETKVFSTSTVVEFQTATLGLGMIPTIGVAGASLSFSEVFPPDVDTLAKIDEGMEKVDQAQQQVDSWWNCLSEIAQNNPMHQARYVTANSALETAEQWVNGIDQAYNNASESTVQYSMDKRLKDAWNFIIGSQYQLNKCLMIRTEFGFLRSIDYRNAIPFWTLTDEDKTVISIESI